MRWVGHVARMGEMGGAYRVLVEKPEGKGPLDDLGVDERIIIKCIFNKRDGGMWTGLILLRVDTGGGLL